MNQRSPYLVICSERKALLNDRILVSQLGMAAIESKTSQTYTLEFGKQ